MVKWNDLKLSEKWSTRKRFNYIMNYIDSTFKDTEPVVETGDVIVLVTNNDNEKVANAKVTLTKDGEEYTGTTGTAGGCTIRNVPYGEYNVVTTAENYIDDTDTVTVDGESVNLTIILNLKEGDSEENNPK